MRSGSLSTAHVPATAEFTFTLAKWQCTNVASVDLSAGMAAAELMPA
jgi:hypothetical protein